MLHVVIVSTFNAVDGFRKSNNRKFSMVKNETKAEANISRSDVFTLCVWFAGKNK
jgi:hypothetical protein